MSYAVLPKRACFAVVLSLQFVLFIAYLGFYSSPQTESPGYERTTQIRVCELGGAEQRNCYSAGLDLEFRKSKIPRAMELTVYTGPLKISKEDRAGREVINFLRRASKVSPPVSVIVQLTERDCSCRIAHTDLQFKLNSCAWWRLLLHGLGFDVLHESSLSRLIAKPLQVNSCGCACEVLKNLTVLQSSKDFTQEFNLSSVAARKINQEVLNVHGMGEQIYDSCAVVHSSGILSAVSPGLGLLIDAHDAVFRFNEAPIGGKFAETVGSKATHRFAYVPPTSQGAHAKISTPFIEQYDKGLLLLSVHFHNIAHKLVDYNISREGGIGVISTEARREASKCVFGAFHEYPTQPISARDGPHLSQGLIGLLLALKTCKRVVLFGKILRDEEDVALQHAFHYFETLPDEIHASYALVHGRNDEIALIERLSDLKTLTVVPGKVLKDYPDDMECSQL